MQITLPAANPQPAVATPWARTAVSAFAQHKLTTSKNTTETNTAIYYSLFGSTSTGDTCWKQFVSDPLDGDQTISGTFSFVALCEELSAAENAHLAISVRLIKPDGTTRATLLSQFVTATEFVTPAATRIFSGALTPGAGLDGDRIALEPGVHGVTPANSSVIGMVFGAPSIIADQPLTSGITLNGVSWAEFSQTLFFKTGTFLALRDPAGIQPDWVLRVNRDIGFQWQPDEVRGSLRRSAAGNMLDTRRSAKKHGTCTVDFLDPVEADAFALWLGAGVGLLRPVYMISDRSGALRGSLPVLAYVQIGTMLPIKYTLNGSATMLWSAELTFSEA